MCFKQKGSIYHPIDTNNKIQGHQNFPTKINMSHKNLILVRNKSFNFNFY